MYLIQFNGKLSWEYKVAIEQGERDNFSVYILYLSIPYFMLFYFVTGAYRTKDLLIYPVNR